MHVVACTHTHSCHSNALEVFGRRGQDLVTALLPLLVADAQQVAAHGGIALGIRQLVRVHVTDGPNDGLQTGSGSHVRGHVGMQHG